MRYQHWDVLLFPDSVTHIPLQEFKAACYATQDEFGALSPTVTAFVPSITRGEPFTISIHSWSKPTPSYAAFTGLGLAPNMLFGVRVLVDGVCVASESYSATSTWPKCLARDSAGRKLLFPPFHREVLSHSHWAAEDSLGRIKVVISEGIEGDQPGLMLQRSKNLVTFAFQPAPLDLLERCGIAWPNPSMWMIAPTGYNQMLGVPSMNLFNYNRQEYSNPFPFGGMLQTSIDPFADIYGRTTSNTSYGQPVISHKPPASHHPGGQKHLELRLPSDQLKQIIEALSPPKPAPRKPSGARSTFTTMPATSSTLAASATAPAAAHMPSSTMAAPDSRRTSGASGMLSLRKESRDSDVSMHAGCAEFPACMQTTPRGTVYHTPTGHVRGRKEMLVEEITPSKPNLETLPLLSGGGDSKPHNHTHITTHTTMPTTTTTTNIPPTNNNTTTKPLSPIAESPLADVSGNRKRKDRTPAATTATATAAAAAAVAAEDGSPRKIGRIESELEALLRAEVAREEKENWGG
ncbi:hypothetical protein LTR66_013438 [Elasticomyces elasticus]|nr:hypothetical protein LTR66_013438 [Elasticomyces elasticus]